MALLFMGAGALLLMNNLGIIEFNIARILFRWPTILFFIGLLIYTKRSNRTGIILMTLGISFILIETLSDYDLTIFDFWPVALIVAGILMIKKRHGANSGEQTMFGPINEIAFFGGNQLRIETSEFKGGAITNVFGGSTLDLRNIKLAPGIQEINVFTIFGGFKVIVPDGLSVKIDVDPVLGEFVDKRRNVPSIKNDAYLRITGSIVFGGGEIMN